MSLHEMTRARARVSCVMSDDKAVKKKHLTIPHITQTSTARDSLSTNILTVVGTSRKKTKLWLVRIRLLVVAYTSLQRMVPVHMFYALRVLVGPEIYRDR